jgi:hypothetical protein
VSTETYKSFSEADAAAVAKHAGPGASFTRVNAFTVVRSKAPPDPAEQGLKAGWLKALDDAFARKDPRLLTLWEGGQQRRFYVLKGTRRVMQLKTVVRNVALSESLEPFIVTVTASFVETQPPAVTFQTTPTSLEAEKLDEKRVFEIVCALVDGGEASLEHARKLLDEGEAPGIPGR